MATVPTTTLNYRDVHTRAGTLEVICGCMFAGKTEALLDQVQDRPPHRVRVFKHTVDHRYNPVRVVSHNRRSCPATPITHAIQLLEQVGDDLDFVAIDEGHFFDDQLPQMCSTLLDGGVHVLVTTLDNDCWGRPFPMIDVLRERADVVTVKSSQCGQCGQMATRTQRLTPIVDRVIVGGAESFEPRCVHCWTPPAGSPDQITRVASNTGPCVQQSS